MLNHYPVRNHYHRKKFHFSSYCPPLTLNSCHHLTLKVIKSVKTTVKHSGLCLCVVWRHMKGGGLSFKSYEYGLRKLKSLHFYKEKIQRDFGPECIPKETFTRTQAVCFCGEAEFRRSLQCFVFLSGDPLIYLTSLTNTD